MKSLREHKGFTLIEIVIVLAIAALIMVIVFIAVAGASRSQRDTTRKSQANQILAAAQQYAGNNSGTMPTAVTDFASYNTPSTDPDGTTYTAAYATGTQAANATTRVVVGSGTCGANGAVVYTANARTFAVSIYQENGGAYCVSS